MNVLAFDVGGTNVKAGVVVWEDGMVRRVSAETVPSGATADEALAAAERAGRARLELFPDCEMVGMCVPGLVENGVVVSLPDKLAGMEGRDLTGWLRDTFELPVGPVVNDAVAAGVWGASWINRHQRDLTRVLTVTIGTGVGTAVVNPALPLGPGPLDNGILTGAMRLRGESIDSLCNAAALAGPYPSPVELYEAHAQGDPAAVAHVDRYREVLAEALAAMAHAHTPTAIVLTGGAMRGESPVLTGLQDMVNEQLFPGYSVRIEAESGLSGVQGVALLAIGSR